MEGWVFRAMNERAGRRIGTDDQAGLRSRSEDGDEIGIRIGQQIRCGRQADVILVGAVFGIGLGPRSGEAGNLVATDDRVLAVQVHGLIVGDINRMAVAAAAAGENDRIEEDVRFGFGADGVAPGIGDGDAELSAVVAGSGHETVAAAGRAGNSSAVSAPLISIRRSAIKTHSKGEGNTDRAALIGWLLSDDDWAQGVEDAIPVP